MNRCWPKLCFFVLVINSVPNRIEVSKEYFEIRNKLNSSNRIKNLKTELEFELRENVDEYYIIIKSSSADHGLRLASLEKVRNDPIISYNENYAAFFKYMFKKIFTLKIQDRNSFNDELTRWLSRLWVL